MTVTMPINYDGGRFVKFEDARCFVRQSTVCRTDTIRGHFGSGDLAFAVQNGKSGGLYLYFR